MNPAEFPELTAAQYRALLAAVRKETFWLRLATFTNATFTLVGLLLALLSIVKIIYRL